MAEITFRCSTCGCELRIDERAAGTTVTCPNCAGANTVPGSRPVVAPTPVSAASPPPGVTRVTSATAVWSMVLGILSSFCPGLLTTIPAIICGHVALKRIRAAPQALAGRDMALAGVILGYLHLISIVAAIGIWLALVGGSASWLRRAGVTTSPRSSPPPSRWAVPAPAATPLQATHGREPSDAVGNARPTRETRPSGTDAATAFQVQGLRLVSITSIGSNVRAGLFNDRRRESYSLATGETVPGTPCVVQQIDTVNDRVVLSASGMRYELRLNQPK